MAKEKQHQDSPAVRSMRKRYQEQKEREEYAKQENARRAAYVAPVAKSYGAETSSTGHKRNSFEVSAQNRRGKVLAQTDANGRVGVRKAKRAIGANTRTWIKFVVYNRTRHKFAKR